MRENKNNPEDLISRLNYHDSNNIEIDLDNLKSIKERITGIKILKNIKCGRCKKEIDLIVIYDKSKNILTTLNGKLYNVQTAFTFGSVMECDECYKKYHEE